MRRIEYSRRREEASCGVRGELLNRGSGVRIPAPALVLDSKATPRDFAHPDADPVLARSWRQRPDWPEPHAAGWRTARLGHVMGDALRDDAPPDAIVRIPAVDLEAGWSARREIQLGSGSSPKSDHALVEEVVDRKDDWPCFVIDERDPTDVARLETFYALGIVHGLELAGPGTEAGHAELHHC